MIGLGWASCNTQDKDVRCRYVVHIALYAGNNEDPLIDVKDSVR